MASGVMIPRGVSGVACRIPRVWTVEVPFLGVFQVERNSITYGETWFATAGIVSEEMNGGAEVWFGRLHLQAWRDRDIRPDWRTWALVALLTAEAVRLL